MFDLETIKAMNVEAATQAAASHLEPYYIDTMEEAATWPPFPFPELGDLRPSNWELVDQLFCDASGMGSESEPALTPGQLLKALEPGYGYAVIEAGQFQIYLGKFKRLSESLPIRHIRLQAGAKTFELKLWTDKVRDGRQYLRYWLGCDDAVIFDGNDFGTSPMHAVDSDDSLRSLLGFLTLRPGDTDEEYFENYSFVQSHFADNYAEELSIYGLEPEEGHEAPEWEDAG